MTRLTHLLHYTNIRTSPDLNVYALARTGHLAQWKGTHLAAMRPCAVRCTSLIRKKGGEGPNSAQCTQKLLKFKDPAAPKRWCYKQPSHTIVTQTWGNAARHCQHLIQSSSLQENSTPIRNLKVTNCAVIHTKTSGKITFESN